uniref:Uncharacterized protein n=1 Tax=Macrostomum lignano TaxID=282301 RepID=A0A1I8F9F0_9PLAT
MSMPTKPELTITQKWLCDNQNSTWCITPNSARTLAKQPDKVYVYLWIYKQTWKNCCLNWLRGMRDGVLVQRFGERTHQPADQPGTEHPGHKKSLLKDRLQARSRSVQTEPEFTDNEGDLLKEFRATKRFHCAHQETLSIQQSVGKVFGEFKFVQSQPHDKLAALLSLSTSTDDERGGFQPSAQLRCSPAAPIFQDLASEPEPTVEIINSFNLFRQMLSFRLWSRR